MSNDLPETGTVESLKIIVNTIKQYCLPEFPENDKGQKPFIGVVLDEVVKETEASICRQETLQETAAAMEKYIYAIPALCRGEDVACALHVSSPIKELRARISALEAMVREFLAEDVDGRESCRLNRDGTPRKDCRCIQCRSLALLQPEAGKEVGK